MPLMLADAGLVDVALAHGVMLLSLAGFGALLGTIGIVWRLRCHGGRWIPILLGLSAIGTAALYAGCFVAWNSHSFESFSAHISRQPIVAVIGGAPLLVGSFALMAGLRAQKDRHC